MKAQRRYWLSNEGNCIEATSLGEVKKIIQRDLNHILEDYGYVCGGYFLHKSNGDSIVSIGIFRLIDNKAKYCVEFIEKYN